MTDDAPFVEPARCTACLGVVADGQRYCLQCGHPLTADARTGGFDARQGPRPSLLLGGGVAVVLVGVLIAWSITRTGARHVSRPGGVSTTAHTQPPVSTLSQSGTSMMTFTSTVPETSTEQTSTAQTSTEQTTTEPTTPSCVPPVAAVDDWPNGRIGWTVVLWSKPPSEVDWCTFVARRAAARGGRYPTAGLLSSDDYGSLRSGYSVLFSGIYPSSAAAWRAAAAARHDWPGAYARRVSASG